VATARGLGQKAVAAGVETGAPIDFLRPLGCAEAQGRLCRKPPPPASWSELLKRCDSS
ncbi:MAG: hypothetical protein GY946_24455, partial [bacterium]|nr:hypothetical protein [bacterium]